MLFDVLWVIEEFLLLYSDGDFTALWDDPVLNADIARIEESKQRVRQALTGYYTLSSMAPGDMQDARLNPEQFAPIRPLILRLFADQCVFFEHLQQRILTDITAQDRAVDFVFRKMAFFADPDDRTSEFVIKAMPSEPASTEGKGSE